jgi:hypothetical protein
MISLLQVIRNPLRHHVLLGNKIETTALPAESGYQTLDREQGTRSERMVARTKRRVDWIAFIILIEIRLANRALARSIATIFA